MRCSSLWTVLLSSSTTVSVIGAIVSEGQVRGKETLVVCASEVVQGGEMRNGNRGKMMKAKALVLSHVGQGSFRAGKMGRARGNGGAQALAHRQNTDLGSR
jgi:hypothetical protein